MMLKRWLAIVRAAETLGESTVIDGVRRLVLPLDAAHDDLPHGDTDYNRDWNRSLLNMLQRADAIAIMATETHDDVPGCHVDFLEQRLLNARHNDTFLKQLWDMRNKDKAHTHDNIKKNKKNN